MRMRRKSGLKPVACRQSRSGYPRRFLRSSHFSSPICAAGLEGCNSIRSRPTLPMRPHRRTSAKPSKSVGTINRT